MEIIVGMLALELKLIPESVFVAIVFAALFSSIIVGPLLAWCIRRRRVVAVGEFLLRGAITHKLEAATRWEAIDGLCGKVASCMGNIYGENVTGAVRERERIMGTGLERGVAVPHARIEGIDEPLVAFGLSKGGITWDARDGLATHFVFLILTPEKEEGLQVQILAAIARVMSQGHIPDRVMAAEKEEDVLNALSEAFSAKEDTRKRQLC
jgi:K+:H+ antiporter